MTVYDKEHGILGALINLPTKMNVLIAELIGIRSTDKNKLHAIYYSNIKTSYPIGALRLNCNYYIITYPDEVIKRTEISFGKDNLRISPGTVSKKELDIFNVEQRSALISLHDKLALQALTNDGYERTRTIGGRYKSKLTNNELISNYSMSHKYTEKNGTKSVKDVNYELLCAIKKSQILFPDGNLLITLNPSTLVCRDGFVPYTYYRLPEPVINKFNQYWRMNGRKVLDDAIYPIDLIKSAFLEKGFPIQKEGIVHLKDKIIQLEPPTFIFGKRKTITLRPDEKARNLVKRGLTEFGPIHKPRKLKIFVATDTLEMINKKSPPKYYKTWPDAFKDYIKLLKRKLKISDDSLFHLRDVEFIGPVYLKGKPKSYLKMVKDLSEKENVDAVLYIIADYYRDKTGMHDLVKEHLKDLPSKCVLIKKLKQNTPRSKEGYSPMFLTIADDLTIGLYYTATGHFPWSIKSKYFDSVVGIDVRREKQTRYCGITATMFTEKGLIRVSKGQQMENGENIPVKILTDAIQELIQKVSNKDLPFSKTLFIRDGFDFENEKEAVKDIMDRNKLDGLLPENHQWVYSQLIKHPDVRFIHEPSLNDPSRLGQPSRGIACIVADLDDWKEGYVITTGYPDIGKKSKSKASDQGLSAPIYIKELERSTNCKITFEHMLETIYHRSFLNPSLPQIRVPIEIPAAEKYMEYLSYGLNPSDMPEFLG